MTGTAIDVFDRWAAGYEQSPLRPVYRLAHRAVLRWLERHPDPRRALDIGCGTGALLRDLAAALPRSTLIGVDPSSGMLSIATATTAGARFVCAAGEHLPFLDETFDLVTSTLSYRHWDDQTTALCEVHRVLTPGGRLIIVEVPPPDAGPTVLSRLGVQRPSWLPAQLASVGLRVDGVEQVGGHAPISAMTVVTAHRPGGAG